MERAIIYYAKTGLEATDHLPAATKSFDFKYPNAAR